jgi:hypothetical protein
MHLEIDGRELRNPTRVAVRNAIAHPPAGEDRSIALVESDEEFLEAESRPDGSWLLTQVHGPSLRTADQVDSDTVRDLFAGYLDGTEGWAQGVRWSDDSVSDEPPSARDRLLNGMQLAAALIGIAAFLAIAVYSVRALLPS